MNMEKDIFAEQPTGQLALKKLAKIAPVPETFRLYSMGWLGEQPKDWTVLKVTGADFRVAKTGPNRGQLSILVKGTQRTVYLTREEILAFGKAKRQPKQAKVATRQAIPA